jgi:hypothetical protein
MRNVIAAVIAHGKIRTCALDRQDVALEGDINVIGLHARDLAYHLKRLIGLINFDRWPPDAPPATPYSSLARKK